jgi:transposase
MKTIRWRQNFYRNLAATLARTYETIVLGKTDWRTLAKLPSGNATAQRNRQRCAIGEFEHAVRYAFTSRKGIVQDVDARDVTHECYFCGYLNTWDAAETVVQTCGKCHQVWDQDENAALVLLKRAQTPSSSATNPTGTLEGSRWSRAKKRKEEKEASV